MQRRESPPSGVPSHVGASRNASGMESDKPPAKVNVNVVVIHSREFKCGKQIKHLFTEFGVANHPAYGAGVLRVEDDDGVMLLLVMGSMVLPGSEFSRPFQARKVAKVSTLPDSAVCSL
jgi:hypothetical protein